MASKLLVAAHQVHQLCVIIFGRFMSLITCNDCGNQVSDSAKACPKCGAKIPRTKWWLWIPLVIFFVIIVIALLTGPKNTTELAEMETASCIKNQGNGEWRASSGVTLETFCRIKGTTKGFEKLCEINPSKC